MEECLPHKCVLRAVVGGEALRTTEVKGRFQELPTKGKRFTMFSESLTPGGTARMISTSPVQEVLAEGGVMIVETENSTYEITIA